MLWLMVSAVVTTVVGMDSAAVAVVTANINARITAIVTPRVSSIVPLQSLLPPSLRMLM